MDRLALEESELRFAAFVESLNEVIGHRDRMGPFRDYCAGLLAGCERKSVEPLAAISEIYPGIGGFVSTIRA